MENFRSYTHRLPHWRVDGATYHVVWRVHWRQRGLAHDEREVVRDALRFFDGERYELVAFAVMDDHVHVIVEPYDPWPLEKIVQSWKGFSSRRICGTSTRESPLWQKTFYNRIIRDEREWEEQVHYVLYNPVERWTDAAGKYPWSGSEGDWDWS